MRKIKILMIGVDRKACGGIASVVNAYYEAGLDMKVNLTYIATVGEGNRFKKLICAIKAFFLYVTYLPQSQVIHVHMASRNSFRRKAVFIHLANLLCKPVIIHLHGAEFAIFYHQECNAKKQACIRKVFNSVRAVIVLSVEWKEKMREICGNTDLIVLPNAVSIPDFRRTDYSDKNVLFMGEVGKRKGVFDLLKVIPDIVKAYPSAMFEICGGGGIGPM